MDHLVSRCEEQLSSFRLKELKAVLSSLGLSKQGTKQVLLDKIVGLIKPLNIDENLSAKGRLSSKRLISREEVARTIDDVFRKIHGTGAVDLASSRKGFPLSLHTFLHPNTWNEAKQSRTIVKCPCGTVNDTCKKIQCNNKGCGVIQHFDCVIFPETPSKGIDPEAPPFFCELCRVNRGDPFCETLKEPLPATNLNFTTSPNEGPLQCIEKTFTLTNADCDLLRKPNHDLQVWCLQLNDKVPYRMNWPKGSNLIVNGVTVKVVNRSNIQAIGANGRDDGPGIYLCTREGINTISFSACDDQPFCLGVRMIRRLTVEQVLQHVPKEDKGEPFEQALARVCRHLTHRSGINVDDDDSDIEVVDDSLTLDMKCPNSGSRIQTAARFKSCTHPACFDLHVFVELNQRTRKWQCPICLKNYSLESLIIDPFINRIAATLQFYGEDVVSVEIKEGGYWRPMLEGEACLHEPWISPRTLSRPFNLCHDASNGQHPVEDSIQQENLHQVCIQRSHDGCQKCTECNSATSSTTTGTYLQGQALISHCNSARDSNADGGEGSVNKQQIEFDLSFLEGALQGSISTKEVVPDDMECIDLTDTEDVCQLGLITPRKHQAEIPQSPACIIIGDEVELPACLPLEQSMFDYFDPLDLPGCTASIEDGAQGLAVLQTSDMEKNLAWESQQLHDHNQLVGTSRDCRGSVTINNLSYHAAPMQMAQCFEFGFTLEQDTDSQMEVINLEDFQPAMSESHQPEGLTADTYIESPLQLFLSPRPARAPAHSTVTRQCTNLQEDVEGSWFSLSLGGNGAAAYQSTSAGQTSGPESGSD